MLANDIPRAERVLKNHLKQAPTDVPAIRMLAEVAVRCGFTSPQYMHAVFRRELDCTPREYQERAIAEGQS